VRSSTAIRAAAWAAVAAGVAAPVLRRRVNLPPAVVIGSGAIAPLALCVSVKRSRVRDISVGALNMWAYLAAYEMPYDDPGRLEARVRIDYPIAADRVLGLGVPPTLRLQRAVSRPGTVNRFERVLVWCHWMWFFVPHTTLAYVLLRDPKRFPAAAARMYAVFDFGAVFYWAVPTAPPWYAAAQGHLRDRQTAGVRRVMLEYGEQFWGDNWASLYDVLGGNPLAAMPSLHFATSLMSAHLLSELGPVSGALGWAYAATLGLALVYLGEHYAVDLLGGAALTESVRLGAPRATPLIRRLSRVLQSLEARAAGG
jgi:membrane-associated phospholipid phosphatase